MVVWACGSPVVKVSDHGRNVMISIPVPLKTNRVGQRWTLNLSRAETSSRGCASTGLPERGASSTSKLPDRNLANHFWHWRTVHRHLLHTHRSISFWLEQHFYPSVVKQQIGSPIGRNQTTVMRICDRWMQEGTTDRRGQSHPTQCTTSRENRQIVRMAVTDRSVTSRTIAQHIESVTHHSVSVRTIQRHLQQSGLSARRPLLGLPLTQNHRRLRLQWCDERRMWVAEWNEVVFTNESRICLQHHDGLIRVWRHSGERMLNSCIMHRHTGSAPGIMVYGGIRYHFRNPLVHIAGTLNSQRNNSEVLEPVVFPYFQDMAKAIFQKDNA
ncbi:transposable element Tcb1 transposase [Trichonephila clavipes]|nr:transposable element Tcb1 transposase [Trichonephila clavipes]